MPIWIQHGLTHAGPPTQTWQILLAGPMEKLHSLPKHTLESEEARDVQSQYDRLVMEMNQYEKATVEVGTCILPAWRHMQVLISSVCVAIAES